MAIPVLDLAIIFGFFALMLGIGAYHFIQRRWAGEYDYFVASGDLHPILAAFTSMATLFSMFTFLGAVGIYFATGLSFTNLIFGETLVFAIMVPTLGYKFWRLSHQHDYVTPADIMADRFDDSDSVRVLVSIALLGSMLMYLTIQYVGISITLEIVTDGFLSFNAVVALMVLVGGIYVAIGGMTSVAWTDLIQGILLTFGMLVLMYVLFFNFDTVSLAQQGIGENAALGGLEASVGSVGWLSWSAEAIAFGLGVFLWPQLWIRYYAARNRKGLMGQSLLLMGGTLFLTGTIGYFLALAAPFTLSSVPSNPDQIAVLFAEQHLASWLSALILTGGAAAALSTLDSVALVLGSIVSHDFVGTYLVSREDMSDRQREVYSRVAAFGLMLVGALLVFGPRGTMVGLLITFGYPAVAGIFPAVFLAMYWKEATKNAAVVSMLVAILVVFGQQVLGVIPTLGIYAGGWAVGVGLVLMIGISLVESESASEQIAEEYNLM